MKKYLVTLALFAACFVAPAITAAQTARPVDMADSIFGQERYDARRYTDSLVTAFHRSDSTLGTYRDSVLIANDYKPVKWPSQATSQDSILVHGKFVARKP